MLKHPLYTHVRACRGSEDAENALENAQHNGGHAALSSNGYSVMVSAEGHCLVNDRVCYHQVVLGVLRGAQT